MKKTIVILLSVVMMTSIAIAYTTTIKAKGIGVTVTSKPGNEITLTPKTTDIIGWEEADEKVTVTNNKFTMPSEDVEINAIIRTYTVTYNANGGSGAPGNQIKTAGTALTLSNTEPQREGYEFLGWSTDSTATTATYIKGGSYTADANITLYAVWSFYNYSINTSPVKYAFTFKDAVELASTGNTITLRTNTAETENATISTGKTITLDLNGNTISTSNKLVEVEGTLTIADSQSTGKINSTSTNSPIEVEGTLNITGGTISAESSTNAIYGGENSTITLGTNDGTINTTLPSITGSERGILSSLGAAVNYYDGVTNGIHATIVTPTGKFYAEIAGLSSLVDSYVTTNLASYYEGKYNSGANKYNETQTENWIDLKGNTNAVLNGPQVSGKALVFDGTNDWLSYGIRNYAKPTFEMVVEANAIQNGSYTYQVLFGNIDESVGTCLGIRSTGQFFMDIKNAAKTVKTASSGAIVETGVKYHIMGTYDGTNIKLYVNGAEVGSETQTDLAHPTATNMVTGVNPSGTTTTDNNAWFNGKVYMVRLYNGSLTAQQAAQNYKASMIKDPVDIHTGGTVENGGVCSICSKQYLTVNGTELIGMDNISNQGTTEYAIVNDNDVNTYSEANKSEVKFSVVTTDEHMTLGTNRHTI